VPNKQVEIKQYKEVFFMMPKTDPRNMAPRVVDEFKKLGFNVRVVDPEKNIAGTQGTGFLITGKGHMLTCAHVLSNENEATIWISRIRYEADVIDKNMDLDLAILKLRNPQAAGITPLSFRDNSNYKMGEESYTIGFPLSNVLGDSARLSKGLVSATAGLKDNPNQIQISAEVQPGNSGGPLLDAQGLVFGVVQQTLNPWKVARQTGGSLPQNVNFAIKSDIVLEYIIYKQVRPEYL
jgi:S1-C subfamily serine protease